MLALAFFVVIFAIVVLARKWWRNTRIPHESFPPGPLGLPIVGHLPTVRSESILVGLDTLHDKYGSVLSVNLGPGPRIVVISDYDVLKELFSGDAATNRPADMNWANEEFRHGDGTDARGIIFSNGKEWSEQKSFVGKRLRSGLETIVSQEVESLCDAIEDRLARPVDIGRILSVSVASVLWHFIAGERLDLEDERLLTMVERLDNLSSGSNKAVLLKLWPSLRHIAPELSGWNEAKKTVSDILDFVKPAIASKKAQMGFDSPDLISAYLEKIESVSDVMSSFHGTLGYHNLESTLLDLMLAGYETSSQTIAYGILIMLHYPHAQKRVQRELDEVVGRDRRPRLEDRHKMPICEATIQE